MNVKKEELIREYEEKYGRRIPRRYVPSYLSLTDLEKQLKSIFTGKNRPALKSARERRSRWTIMAREYFGEGKTSKEDMAKILSRGNAKREREIYTGLSEIYDKGLEAYRSSGSRPLQTSFSWAMARVFSVLFGGASREIDKYIVEKYDIPLLEP